VRFLTDAQLPPALTHLFSDLGHVCEHVRDVGLMTAGDREIWDYATRCDAILVTKDGDFAAFRSADTRGPAIIWIRLGNTRRQVLVEKLKALLPDIMKALKEGEQLVEIVEP
jgi:predicted nuclease of predicted toxin-antitoxin system